MPIESTDIKYRLSGGAANSDQALSLGGAKSSVDAVNYFDAVSSVEASAGDAEYRCIYVHNAHPTLTLLGAKIWIQLQTPSADTDIAIGLGASAINGVEATAPDESTPPAGVVFSAPSSFAGGLSIGDLAPGEHKAICIRRTVNSGAASVSDNFTLRVQGDSNP